MPVWRRFCYFQCEVSLQSADDKSVQRNDNDAINNNNYYNDSGGNLSSLLVADVHVTTFVPLQRQHAARTSSSSSGSSNAEAEFDVVINQSHYELHQPPLTSRDVIVYVMYLVCIVCIYKTLRRYINAVLLYIIWIKYTKVGILLGLRGLVDVGLRLKGSRVQLPAVPRSGNHLGQVVHTCAHVPLSPSSIIWYQSRGSDALRLGR